MPTNDLIVNRINEALGGKTIISRDELFTIFIDINPDITDNAKRNRIHHLVQKGFLTTITNSHFTNDVKANWKPTSNNEINSAWKLLFEEFTNTHLCFWSTKWINEFTNLQAFNEVIFIEAEEIVAESIYHRLNDKYNRVFYAPEEKEIEFYISTKMLSYVVRPLITRAPIIYPIQSSTSKKPKYRLIPHPPRPRLEKLLTDLYYDSKILSAWKYEEEKIWQDAYKSYNINFSTIINYAKRRDNSTRIIDFITATLNHLPDDITNFLKER